MGDCFLLVVLFDFIFIYFNCRIFFSKIRPIIENSISKIETFQFDIKIFNVNAVI